MTYTLEILLRGTHTVVTRTVTHPGNEPQDWTDRDVELVLKGMLGGVDRVKNPELDERPVSLRGLSWIVEAGEGGVLIAIEIHSGAAVAGPFDIARDRLDGMIARVLAAAGQSDPTVH